MADNQIDISDNFDSPRKLLHIVDDGETNANSETLYSVAVSGSALADLLTELEGKADQDETQPSVIYDSTGAVAASVDTATDDDTNLDGKNALTTGAILYARIDADTIKPARMDASTHSLQIIDYEHHEIHSGSHYIVSGFQELGNGEVLDFTWQMPNTTAWIHWIWHISTESETTWYIYEGVTAENPLANTITPINSNRNSNNTSGTTMRYELQASLAAANADTSVGGALLIGSGKSGAGKDSGFSKREEELILEQNTLYCLRAFADAAGYVSFHMSWYEHTDKG